jgi:hypothetical protein
VTNKQVNDVDELNADETFPTKQILSKSFIPIIHALEINFKKRGTTYNNDAKIFTLWLIQKPQK